MNKQAKRNIHQFLYRVFAAAIQAVGVELEHPTAWWVCVHPSRMSLVRYTDADQVMADLVPSFPREERVDLEPLTIMGRTVLVGQCQTCGRIYFRWLKPSDAPEWN